MDNNLLCRLCGGKLKSKDNENTPIGLFECIKCKSVFRLVVVRDNFTVYKPYVKPIKIKKTKVKHKIEDEE
jgi:hypothetical protein